MVGIDVANEIGLASLPTSFVLPEAHGTFELLGFVDYKGKKLLG